MGSWFPDEAHIPAPIDAWARGTVRARRRPQVAEQDIPRATVGASSKLSATMGAPRAGVRMGGASTLRKTGARLSSTMPRKSFPAAREAVPAKPLRRKQKMTPEEMERERRLRGDRVASSYAGVTETAGAERPVRVEKLSRSKSRCEGETTDTTTTASSSWLISSIQTRCQASSDHEGESDRSGNCGGGELQKSAKPQVKQTWRGGLCYEHSQQQASTLGYEDVTGVTLRRNFGQGWAALLSSQDMSKRDCGSRRCGSTASGRAGSAIAASKARTRAAGGNGGSFPGAPRREGLGESSVGDEVKTLSAANRRDTERKETCRKGDGTTMSQMSSPRPWN